MRVSTIVHYNRVERITVHVDTESTSTAIAEGRAMARTIASNAAASEKSTFQLGDTQLDKESE